MSKHLKHYSLGAIVQIIKEKKERRKKKGLILTLQIEESHSLKWWWPKGVWKPVNVQQQPANYGFLNASCSSPDLGAVSTSNCLLTWKKRFFSDTNPFFRTLAITPPGVRFQLAATAAKRWGPGTFGFCKFPGMLLNQERTHGCMVERTRHLESASLGLKSSYLALGGYLILWRSVSFTGIMNSGHALFRRTLVSSSRYTQSG